eukprot:3477585-Prymnesium_polylepis.2
MVCFCKENKMLTLNCIGLHRLEEETPHVRALLGRADRLHAHAPYGGCVGQGRLRSTPQGGCTSAT